MTYRRTARGLSIGCAHGDSRLVALLDFDDGDNLQWRNCCPGCTA
ncbi:hypothetical protein ACFYZ4_16495 [Streptomyces sp. NPDC001513]